jgi:hypothetical protein
MAISVDTWALVLATAMGPVLAVQAQKYIERAGENRRRKLHCFYTLMATRATRISNDHVQALNVIELEFNRGWFRNRSKEKAVVDAWRIHLDNLNQQFPDETDSASIKVWVERCEVSFNELLYSMAQAVGYKEFDRVQLKRGAYYTRGQGELDQTQRAILINLAKVLAGQQPIGMNVVAFPIDKDAAAMQAQIHAEYLKALTGKGALYVAVKNDKPPR